MTFEKWLTMNGYYPLERIKENYRQNGHSEKEVQEYVDVLIHEYQVWCDTQ